MYIEGKGVKKETTLDEKKIAKQKLQNIPPRPLAISVIPVNPMLQFAEILKQPR